MSAVNQDYYQILGVPRDADAKTIKDAFRKLAHTYHPDRNKSPDAEERFKEIADRNVKDVLEMVSERLDKFCKDMESQMTECPFLVEEILVKEGNPVEEILKQAELCDADMIVMGTHGQGVLVDVMMGSTARRVVRRSQVPVLVIRLPAEG